MDEVQHLKHALQKNVEHKEKFENFCKRLDEFIQKNVSALPNVSITTQPNADRYLSLLDINLLVRCRLIALEYNRSVLQVCHSDTNGMLTVLKGWYIDSLGNVWDDLESSSSMHHLDDETFCAVFLAQSLVALMNWSERLTK
ncbi:MAG: hypothetical protein JJ956_19395 [Pseudomonadales bacterium]|nr:hypothetical protein [Pseudomonadales bacterium]